MPIVVDASSCLSFCLPDERSDYGEQLIRHIVRHGAFVPPLWETEMANGLLMAERERRISISEVDAQMRELSGLPIDAKPVTLQDALAIARQHKLTVYDAAYLRLAIVKRATLATLDKDLKDAAKLVGIRLFQA
ncbi:MAG: type II toxin-antitoxin system VapC family toxin [Acidobacteriaceae bacterium]